ncbi:MAG: methylated-DNA--protein-cysteine methyltransferase [Leptospiraceae bacterium]|nr:MAG: methylated-DNA--protein-cysteine methyltransferase [Leptospiraceae bacterium]
MFFYYNYESIFLKIKIEENGNLIYITEIDFIKKPGKNFIIKNHQLKKFINTIYDYFDAYFYHKRTIKPPLFRLKGTNFQKTIWKTLTKIPLGKFISYQELGILAGYNIHYARAIGNACNKNPIPIIVPCHRVIGKNHQLIGFAGGIEIKKWLLEHEGCKI